jgi:tRNA A-37 threonylcarbamoyl transferase component Bud32
MTVGVRSCPRCATALADGAVFCHVCGERTPTGAYTIAPAPDNETRRRLIGAVGRDYELRDMLGAGGFAEVYLAWDRKLKREVAIKTLHSELIASADVRERFRREAEAIAQLRHPHIVPIYSVAEGEGVAWFVMPRVHGVSLATALKAEDRWSFAEVCRILREAAGALSAAHAMGIVHRDIKPENIMLEGPERRVVLMDFGIAKSLGDVTSTLTGTGMMIGTPQYMSPEQAGGDATIGPLSDQYSLALVGYRLLTGRPAFRADSVRSLMAMQASMPAAPVRDLRPDAPLALAAVIERALAKDSGQRFPSMQAFADALDRVARDVAGEYRRGRRTVPMADRWVDSMRRATSMRRPAFLAIAAGLLLTAVSLPYTVSSNVHRVLRTRHDALVAARLALGANDDRSPVWGGFMRNDVIYKFLQRAVGPDSADRLAYERYHVWTWEYDFERAGPFRGYWMYFAKDAQLVAHQVMLPDSLRRGAVSAERAREIADSVIRSYGEDPSRLTFEGIETTIAPRVTTHSIRWYRPGSTIIRGNDTLSAVVRVTVAGTIPTFFQRRGELRGPGLPEPPPAWRQIISLWFPFILSIIGLAAVIVVIRRGANDVVQWAMGLRITAPVLVIWFLVSTVGTQSGVQGLSSISSRMNRGAPAQLCMWILATLCLVAAESLWYESKPELTAGLDDLARGRVRTPELIPGALAGYAWGLALLGAGSTIIAIGHRWFGVPYASLPVLDLAFENRLPWLVPLVPAVFGFTVTAVILFIGGALQRRRGFFPLLSLVTAIVAVSAFVAIFGFLEVIVFTALMTLMPICIMRAGYVAGVIATSFAIAVLIAVDLLWAGGPFVVPGVIASILLLLPGVWAVRLYIEGRQPVATR